MFFSVLLALSLSADALGIGLAYGLRRISFPPLSRLLLAAETFFMMEGFLLLGGLLSQFVPQAGRTGGAGFPAFVRDMALFAGIWAKKRSGFSACRCSRAFAL